MVNIEPGLVRYGTIAIWVPDSDDLRLPILSSTTITTRSLVTIGQKYKPYPHSQSYTWANVLAFVKDFVSVSGLAARSSTRHRPIVISDNPNNRIPWNSLSMDCHHRTLNHPTPPKVSTHILCIVNDLSTSNCFYSNLRHSSMSDRSCYLCTPRCFYARVPLPRAPPSYLCPEYLLALLPVSRKALDMNFIFTLPIPTRSAMDKPNAQIITLESTNISKLPATTNRTIGRDFSPAQQSCAYNNARC